jgi:hypothetical protein
MMLTTATEKAKAKNAHRKIPQQQSDWMQARLELRQRPIVRKWEQPR